LGYYTRVLSKDEEFPIFDELAQFIRAEHPQFKLTVEEGTEDEWESLLLSGNVEVEVAVTERNLVCDGSLGQDEVAEFIEYTEDCKPESGVAWLTEFLGEVRTIYSFQHLQGADTEEGSNVLLALRSKIWERGDSIIQADLEGFTNEEGYHIVWQFSDSVSGHGIWESFRTEPGTTLKWTSAIPIIVKPF
jgi:hypothetical protein